MNEINETVEEKTERWLSSIQQYLQVPDSDATAKARLKNPFLDWVLKNPDIDPIMYFMPAPTPPKPPSVPFEIESPGMNLGKQIGKETEMILKAIAELKAIVIAK